MDDNAVTLQAEKLFRSLSGLEGEAANSRPYQHLLRELQQRLGVASDGLLGLQTAEAIIKAEAGRQLQSILEKLKDKQNDSETLNAPHTEETSGKKIDSFGSTAPPKSRIKQQDTIPTEGFSERKSDLKEPRGEPEKDTATDTKNPRSGWAFHTDTVGEPSFSGFSNDNINREDSLNLTGEVMALCSIIASRDVSPPLSIGLFGDWGTGKSFFIKEMIACLKTISARSREIEQAHQQGETLQEPDYWSNIAQITFNAWHFEDADLWASLVVRIFDALSDHICDGASDPNTAQKEREAIYTNIKLLENEVNSLQAQMAAASREKDQAKEQLNEKKQALEQARIHSQKPKLDQLQKDALQVLTRQKPELQALLNTLGLAGITENAQRWQQQLNELQSHNSLTSSKLQALFHSLKKPRNLFYMTLVTAVGLAVPYATTKLQLIDTSSNFFELKQLVSQALTFAGGYVALWSGWKRKLSTGIDKLLALNEEYQQLCDESISREQQQYHQSQQALEHMAQRVDDCERDLQAATARFEQTKAEINAITSGKLLQRFLDKQQGSRFYRDNLGIVSAIREDFSRLSEILAEQSRAKRKSWEQQPDGSNHAENNNEVGSSSNDQIKKFADVDRIVLYIDDLDRCSPERVVEILRAVHLLLAFELFVVVVAVDSRWLLNSLKLSMHNISNHPEDDAAHPQEHDESLTRNLVLTPQNYLEKIFQIPYALRPISKRGMEQLLKQLAKPLDNTVENTTDTTVKTTFNPTRDNRPSPQQHRQTKPSAGVDAAPPLDTKVNTAEVEAKQDSTIDSIHDPSKNAYASIRLNSSRHNIQGYELEAMNLTWGNLTTPRAVNRFVNTYRFIRSMVADTQQNDFFHTLNGDYQRVIFLLIIIIGYPQDAEGLFREIHNAEDEKHLYSILNTFACSPESQKRIESLCANLKKHRFFSRASAGEFRKLLPHIARFSFKPLKFL